MSRSFTLRQHIELSFLAFVANMRLGRWLKCQFVGHDTYRHKGRPTCVRCGQAFHSTYDYSQWPTVIRTDTKLKESSC